MHPQCRYEGHILRFDNGQTAALCMPCVSGNDYSTWWSRINRSSSVGFDTHVFFTRGQGGPAFGYLGTGLLVNSQSLGVLHGGVPEG